MFKIGNLELQSRLHPLANVNLKDFITFPNTAGAKTAQEAIRIAEIANHAGVCDMIKVEVIGDDETLLPDPFETYEACKVLLEKGYTVCPYISNDLVLAQRLEELGVHAVIVDAGIGSPKDACHAMELGADGILLNTAISAAKDPVKMAEAMKLGINAGRLSYEAGRIPVKYTAQASSPSEGLGFL
ncbi:MAG: thiazole synthase [Staphylococcus epidermidis]|nr:thiazole synthase [Staphylococcus epidermidis]